MKFQYDIESVYSYLALSFTSKFDNDLIRSLF